MARNPAPEYPPLPYHGIRAITFISASIVSGILIYFCYHLKHDNFKLPWTFLIILSASVPALLALTLTACVRSALFALILNVPTLLVWSAGFILLAYNMYGALGHSCTATNWGSHDGISICQTYKILFAFTVIGWLAAVAGTILDLRVRSAQHRLGAYDQMNGAGGNEWDSSVKMDTLTDNGPIGEHPIAHGPRPVTLQRSLYESYDHGEQAQPNDMYGDERGQRFGGNGDVNMADFRYAAPTEQTMYDSAGYGEHGGRGPFDPAPLHHGGAAYAHGARY